MTGAHLFSGQGSQYVGMIKDLVAEFPKAQEVLQQADNALGYSLSTICFEGPADVLKETRYTQPALFVHEAILIQLLNAHLPFQAVAGHSLGEYSALYAAGVLDFKTALALVQLRGNLMFEAGEKQPGTMFAIIGLKDEQVKDICGQLNTGEHVVVPANFNAPGQVVVSGSAAYLREHAQDFKDAGARMVMELPVSGAFHSPLLESAKERLAEAINAANFNDAAVSVYSNVTARPLRDASAIRAALIDQLVSPVLWTQTMEQMKADGIEAFYEIGPGTVLQGLIKRTLPGVSFSGFDKADQVRTHLAE